MPGPFGSNLPCDPGQGDLMSGLFLDVCSAVRGPPLRDGGDCLIEFASEYLAVGPNQTGASSKGSLGS